MTIHYPWMTDRAKTIMTKESDPPDSSKNRKKSKLFLAENGASNYQVYGQPDAPMNKIKSFPPDHLGEWERVLKMRKENHPLIKGGRHIDNRKQKIIYGYQTIVENKPERKTQSFWSINKANTIWD